MNIVLRASVGLLVVLVGMCIGGVGRVVGAPPAPDATLTITPSGELHDHQRPVVSHPIVA